jgi:hypothetical protein
VCELNSLQQNDACWLTRGGGRCEPRWCAWVCLTVLSGGERWAHRPHARLGSRPMGKGELVTLLGNSAVLKRAFGRLWTEEELGRLATCQVLRGMVLQRGQQLFKKVRPLRMRS